MKKAILFGTQYRNFARAYYAMNKDGLISTISRPKTKDKHELNEESETYLFFLNLPRSESTKKSYKQRFEKFLNQYLINLVSLIEQILIVSNGV